MSDSKKITNPFEGLSDNMKAIVKFMQANEGDLFASDIAEGTGVAEKSVNPVLTALVKRTICEKGDAGQKEVKDKNGNPVTRTYQRYHLTAAGADLVIE